MEVSPPLPLRAYVREQINAINEHLLINPSCRAFLAAPQSYDLPPAAWPRLVNGGQVFTQETAAAEFERQVCIRT